MTLPTEHVTVTIQVRNRLEVTEAAIAKASSWYDATKTGRLPDGRQLAVKLISDPRAALEYGEGTVRMWEVDAEVGVEEQ